MQSPPPPITLSLQTVGDVELGQETIQLPGHPGATMRYGVRNGWRVETYDRIHQAWERFRELTGR